MEDRLIELLTTLGYPVRRQGSLAPTEAYPDTFITFWNNSEDGEAFYDNETASVSYDYYVYVYSSNPATVYTLLESARTLLRSNGWITVQRGFDIASDEPTHTGRGMEVEYLSFDLVD